MYSSYMGCEVSLQPGEGLKPVVCFATDRTRQAEWPAASELIVGVGAVACNAPAVASFTMRARAWVRGEATSMMHAQHGKQWRCCEGLYVFKRDEGAEMLADWPQEADLAALGYDPASLLAEKQAMHMFMSCELYSLSPEACKSDAGDASSRMGICVWLGMSGSWRSTLAMTCRGDMQLHCSCACSSHLLKRVPAKHRLDQGPRCIQPTLASITTIQLCHAGGCSGRARAQSH
jgi:hypothetical protein